MVVEYMVLNLTGKEAPELYMTVFKPSLEEARPWIELFESQGWYFWDSSIHGPGRENWYFSKTISYRADPDEEEQIA